MKIFSFTNVVSIIPWHCRRRALPDEYTAYMPHVPQPSTQYIRTDRSSMPHFAHPSPIRIWLSSSRNKPPVPFCSDVSESRAVRCSGRHLRRHLLEIRTGREWDRLSMQLRRELGLWNSCRDGCSLWPRDRESSTEGLRAPSIHGMISRCPSVDRRRRRSHIPHMWRASLTSARRTSSLLAVARMQGSDWRCESAWCCWRDISKPVKCRYWCCDVPLDC